ncbi:MAG TPA: hypothetical protein VHE35_36670 [Kofleriaceae bacterium]|nr:hypothetical protein [Kofleriaceae bacterium]
MRAAWLTVLGLAGQLALAGAGAIRAADASPGGDDELDGTVFGGSTAPTPANLTANPSALMRLPDGLHLFLHGSARLDRLGIDRTLIDPSGATRAGPSVSDSVVSGGGGAAVAKVGGRGHNVIAAGFRWHPDEATIDRDATAYQGQADRSRRIDWVTIAFGFQPVNRVYVALSGTLTGRREHLAFARDTALEAGSDPARGIGSDCGGAACGFENPAARESWSVDVEPDSILSTDNLMYSVGAMMEVTKDLWVAASTERPWQLGRLTMPGTVDVTAAPRDGGAVHSGQASVTLRLPVVWRIGVRGRVMRGWDAIGEVRLRRLDRIGVYGLHTLGGDLVRGDVPEWYPRPRALEDSYAAWGGLEQVDDGRVVRFGAWLGADSGATDDAALSATSPWGAELSASIGLQLRLRERWVVQLGTQVRYQPAVDTGTSAYDPLARVACVDSGYDRDLPACATVRDGYGLPTAAGTYRRWSPLATLSLRIEVP